MTLKRCFDIVCATFGLILLAPLMLIMGIEVVVTWPRVLFATKG